MSLYIVGETLGYATKGRFPLIIDACAKQPDCGVFATAFFIRIGCMRTSELA